MARHRSDLGARKSVRIELQTQGFLIPAPDAPWIECTIVDVGDGGVCLEVGDLAVPKLFGLAFTAGGEVLRELRRCHGWVGAARPFAVAPVRRGNRVGD
jgi:hypothetical protein